MNRILAVVCLSVVLMTAGCIGGDPPPKTEIAYSGSFNVSNDSFRMVGAVTENGYHPDKKTYRGIMVCFYSDRGELLFKTPPKTMNETRRTSVSVTLDRVPKYVIINSSGFWSAERVQRVAYYGMMTNGGEPVYKEKWADHHEELPIQNCSQ